MASNNEFPRELKIFMVFLASGAFAAVHKQFLKPSSEISSIFPCANDIHHWGHFLIGVVLQLLILAWLAWIAWHVVVEPIRSLFRRKSENIPEKTE